jgi:hypothetical protein
LRYVEFWGGGVMKQIALEEHLINRLNDLKEERKSLKHQKLRSIKETIDIQFILAKFREEKKHG